jgi:hypothetical protein
MGNIQTAQIVQTTSQGSIVQLLCADSRGLLSVYLEDKPFNLLCKATKKAGLDLKGLLIGYDRKRVYVPALGKTWVSHNVL